MLRPIYAQTLRYVDVSDPWEIVRDVPISPHAFGAGSLHPFGWYFDGTSQVPVKCIKEVCNWLRQCEYISDFRQFGVMDHWQHPLEFEVRRKGDCDDHAVWAWRKLQELGYEARLFSGNWLGSDAGSPVPHVWISFREQSGETFVLESISKSPERILLPFEQAQSSYQPFFSVGGDMIAVCHAGFAVHLRNSLIAGRRRDRAMGRSSSSLAESTNRTKLSIESTNKQPSMPRGI